MTATDAPVVLVSDDDPTGSQVVRDVDLHFDLDGLRSASWPPGSTTFVLTNSRSLDALGARQVNEEVGRIAAGVARDHALVLVGRGDSTLRGHVREETEGLVTGLREGGHRGGVRRVFCPVYVPAGRVTEGDVHYCRLDDELVPVSQTPFARDPSFGYDTSDLREFLVRRGAAARADDVLSVSLDRLRAQGEAYVAETVRRAEDRWVVLNATTEADLDVAARGIRTVADDGLLPVVRSGPSLVRALAGQPPPPPLTESEVRDQLAQGGGRGLVVVGSHVLLTTQQLADLLDQPGVADVEVDVRRAADADRSYLAELAARAAAAPATADLAIWTSREVVHDDDGLGLARRTSRFLVELVRRVVRDRPVAWVVAKGGITSHDIARHALGIRSGRVVGQLLAGQVSLLRPTVVRPGSPRVPYVIFAGNVGDRESLTEVRRLLAAA